MYSAYSQKTIWQKYQYGVYGAAKESVVLVPQECSGLVSILYISVTLYLARLLRYIITQTTPSSFHNTLTSAISTFQLVACSLECGIVREALGYIAYAVLLFYLGVWYSWTFRASFGNPCDSIVAYLQGSITLLHTIVNVTLQILCGLLAYVYATYAWKLELSQDHQSRLTTMMTGLCQTSLQIDAFRGFLVEFSATFLVISINLTMKKRLMKYSNYIGVAFGIVLTILGLNLTGMYMNPANAAAQTFGCHGSTSLNHVTVYWLGPGLASAAAVYTDYYFHEKEKVM